jgi:6-phosphogluconolactonase/glucosamine-6-phosphate isomerase/deaminase
MNVVYDPDKSIVLEKAQKALQNLFRKHQNQPILFLISGGSAFSLLEDFDALLLSPDLTIAVLDERASADPNENNFAQLTTKDFYQKALNSTCNFIDTRLKDSETKEELAKRFESKLKDWKLENPTGICIATIGIGSDGHTAGIPVIPNEVLFNQLFINPTHWVTSFNADEIGWDNPYKNRVTITPLGLKELINEGIIFACGEDKKEMLARALNPDEIISKTPARILRDLEAELSLFTDNSI